MVKQLTYHRIVLLRARPGSEASRLALARIREWAAVRPAGLLVFLHGPGVEHAAFGAPDADWRRLAEWHDVGLEVCSAAWQRRHRQALAEPWQLSSLVTFWDRLLNAPQLVCFGDGQDLRPRVESMQSVRSDPPWLIVISTAPADPDSREMLELVLAGAALDCPLAVVFTGPGVDHLEPDRFRAWRQLIDFDLAPIHLAAAAHSILPPAGVELLDHSALAALCKSARGVMEL